MAKVMVVVAATTNRGKAREIQAILTGDPRLSGIEVATLADVGAGDFDYEETSDTFSGNALGKALAAAKATNLAAIADDSGLCVDALGGEPGVRSARWAGEEIGDDERNRLLLRRLEGVSEAARTARFVCAVAVALPNGKNALAEGTCEGVITSESKGTGGFGYDPIFFLPTLGRTFAELSSEEKNRVSHRRVALSGIAARLYALLSE